MSKLRAELRRQRRRERHFPIVTGVIPECTEEWQRIAMEQAHEELPPLPNSRVTVWTFGLEEGLEKLRSLGYGEHQIAFMRAKVAEIGGPDPHIVISARVPHEYEHRHEHLKGSPPC